MDGAVSVERRRDLGEADGKPEEGARFEPPAGDQLLERDPARVVEDEGRTVGQAHDGGRGPEPGARQHPQQLRLAPERGDVLRGRIGVHERAQEDAGPVALAVRAEQHAAASAVYVLEDSVAGYDHVAGERLVR